MVPPFPWYGHISFHLYVPQTAERGQRLPSIQSRRNGTTKPKVLTRSEGLYIGLLKNLVFVGIEGREFVRIKFAELRKGF
jgi:hypothetical protein